MKAVLCKSFGPPESLVVEDAPSPQIKPSEILLTCMLPGSISRTR